MHGIRSLCTGSNYSGVQEVVYYGTSHYTWMNEKWKGVLVNGTNHLWEMFIHRWEDNIEVSARKLCCKCGDWHQLVYEWERWQLSLKIIMNFLHVRMICVTNLYDCVNSYTVIILYVLYAFVCFWHVPYPVVWWQPPGSMECVYVYMFVCTSGSILVGHFLASWENTSFLWKALELRNSISFERWDSPSGVGEF